MSFSFGAPSSAPATGALASGFSFGANKPATPGFGLATSQPSTGLNFGSTPATSAPAFGTATPSFGATSGFGNTSFGPSTTPAFGATSTTPAFGTTGTTSAFGAASTAPAFGATAAPAFGTTAGFGATSTAPAFGSTAATATLPFGTSSAASAFGSTTAPAFGQTSTPGFGTGLGTGGLNFGTGSATSTAGTGLTLGGTTTTSSGLGGLGGFGFGTTTTQSTGLGGGLFGATTSASTGLFGAKLGTTTVAGAQPSASGAPSLGLGGIAPAGTTTTTASGDGKTEPPKQTKIPNEIASTVDTFKEFVKRQKTLSSEIMRVSIKPLHKVSRDAEVLLRAALSAAGAARSSRAHSRRLRAAAAAALAAAESVNNAAIYTGGSLEGVAPPPYVSELIAELEEHFKAFRQQMDVADKQMQHSPKLLTEQELTLGIRRMHMSLVALAGRLQAAHSQVQEHREQYLQLRRRLLHDHTDPFQHTASTSLDQILWEEGSRKKLKPDQSGLAGSAVLADPRAALGNLSQLAGPTPFTYIGSAVSPFPTADNTIHKEQYLQLRRRLLHDHTDPFQHTDVPWQAGATLNNSLVAPPAAPAATPFQLQRPPGKRGKQ